MFEASADKIFTFSELSRSGEARFEEHVVIEKKPRLEFLGPGLEEVSFKMMLMAAHGVDPDEEMKKLREMRDKGEVGTLVFGEDKVGKFVLTSLSGEEGPRDKKGMVTWIDASLSLKEYVEDEAK